MGGTGIRRKGISDTKVQMNVLNAAIRGIGTTVVVLGSKKYWLQPHMPNPIIALQTSRLEVDAGIYLFKL